MRTISLLTLVAAVMSAVLTGQLFGVTWVNWRIVDALAIACGGSSFFVVAGEAARLIPANELPYKKGYASNWLHAHRTWLEHLPKIIGVQFERAEASLPNFEEVQRQHDLIRPWAQDVSSRILSISSQELPDLTLETIPPFPSNISDPFILEIRDELYEIVRKYEKLRTEAFDAMRQLERTALEQTFILASPPLVAVAVGLTLFKALYGPQ
jgi:hypothetical protein